MLENELDADVHMNMQTGDFESLTVDESTDEVVISDPDTGKELDRISEDTVDYGLYVPVQDSAVEDPTLYYIGHVDAMLEDLQSEIPVEVQVAFRYCQEHVKVTEADSDD